MNKVVREAITLALIRLMDKKDFSQITITELIRTAGVSRSSFYRNFASKEQVLIRHIHDTYKEFFRSQDIPARLTDISGIQDFLFPRFQFIRENRAFFSVLSKNHLLYFVFDQLESELVMLLGGQEYSSSPYFLAAISGACAGVIQKWIENDFRESDEELVGIFASETLRLGLVTDQRQRYTE